MQTIFRRFRYAAWLICASALWPATVPAQTGAPASSPVPLSADAQDIVNKGIIAARQQDYLQAVRYFQGARKIAPKAPEIYFDLGLAESKIPGRELRAIAWFAAYLIANPSAPNATTINNEIRELDVKSHGNMSRLIATVQKTAGQIPDASDSEFALINVAGLWAEAGDVTEAKRIADPVQGAVRAVQARRYIAEGQLRAGDIAGAQRTADNMLPRGNKYERESNVDDRIEVLKSIASACDKVGNVDVEKKALLNAAKLAEVLDNQSRRGTQLELIAAAQAKAGDIAGAQGTLASLQLTKTYKSLGGAERDIAYATQKGEGYFRDFYKRVDADFVKKQQSSPTVSDWLKLLDYERATAWDFVGLNTAPFLDLSSYLIAQRSDDPRKFHNSLIETARIAIKAQNNVDDMLKRQARKY